MAKGWSIPMRANKRGGVQTSVGNRHVMDLLYAALKNADSDNPFQELGLGEDMIFDIADATTFNSITEKLERIFADFREAELADLQERSDNLQVIPDPKTSGGSWIMNIYFVNLESDQPGTLRVLGNESGIIRIEEG